MNRILLLHLLVLGTVANGVITAAVTCDTGSQAVLEARAVATGIITADNARDIERVLQYYTADAILMPPGEMPVVGREAIRPRYAELFASFNPEIEARVDEACADDGLAYVRGHNGGLLVPRREGNPRALDDAYLMVLRRDTDGVWRISRLMWHRESPATPASSK